MHPLIEITEGDITEADVDAIVNAANRSLLGGGGVDGAIHRRGGPVILEACKRLRAMEYPHGLSTGEAVATEAGALTARWIIHTVGPVYAQSADPPGELARCHVASLAIADQLGARSVAFPAISTGVYGYPIEQAARVALRAGKDANTRVERIRFVLYGAQAHAIFKRAWEEIA